MDSMCMSCKHTNTHTHTRVIAHIHTGKITQAIAMALSAPNVRTKFNGNKHTDTPQQAYKHCMLTAEAATAAAATATHKYKSYYFLNQTQFWLNIRRRREHFHRRRSSEFLVFLSVIIQPSVCIYFIHVFHQTRYSIPFLSFRRFSRFFVPSDRDH